MGCYVEGEAPADYALAETSKPEDKPKLTTAENIGKDIGSPVMRRKMLRARLMER